MADIFVAQKQNGKKAIIHGDIEPHTNILSTFSHHPTGISFQTQKEKELIILFLRSHLITNLSWVLIALVLILLPPIGLTVLPSFGMDFLSTPVANRFIIVFTLFYYLLVFSYVFISFLHWFYNVFIVTSERVVDIDYSDIVVHNIAITSLHNVEDVSYTQSGFIPHFFHYGDLCVQTAGEEKYFEALSIPKPREAAHIIGDLTGKRPK